MNWEGFGGEILVGRSAQHSRHHQNRQKSHGRLLALYFVGQAEGGQGVLQNRQNRQNCQNRVMKANPP